MLTWLSIPEERRHPALLTALREAMVGAVTTQRPAVQEEGPAGAARALRAMLPEQTTLSDGERHLLGEWLDRLAADELPPRPAPGTFDSHLGDQLGAAEGQPTSFGSS